MTECRYVIGKASEVLAQLPDRSVNSVITSPPYLAKRAYLPDDHPRKADEIGQEDTPAEFLAALLALTDDLWRVLADDGTIWINLGDTASGSGGSGGDYNEGGLREGQGRWSGSAARNGRDLSTAKRDRWASSDRRPGWPRAKSVCWIPELFGASLAYGRNLLSGEPCRQWVTRPPVTWCKPNPPVGELIDKFREATELIVWASKQGRYYFDLDAVREDPSPDYAKRPQVRSGLAVGHPRERAAQTRPDRACNEKGVPPKNWWEIGSQPYTGAHFAVFPPRLIERPVVVSCPLGGVILDPFGGSGTTGMVATGLGRDALLIDLNERNLDLARDRVGPMLLTEATADEAAAWLSGRTSPAEVAS